MCRGRSALHPGRASLAARANQSASTSLSRAGPASPDPHLILLQSRCKYSARRRRRRFGLAWLGGGDGGGAEEAGADYLGGGGSNGQVLSRFKIP